MRTPHPAPSRRAAGIVGAAILSLGVVAAAAGCATQVSATAATQTHSTETRTTATRTTAVVPTTRVPRTTPATTGLLMAASPPVRLQVPAIGVDTNLMRLGLKSDGSIEVPPLGFPAGWFAGAPTPGELGPAVLAGHVDWAGAPGVFYQLRAVTVGDEITIDRADGSVAVFRVIRTAQYPKNAFPTDQVYGDLDHAGLRLITCGGSFNPGARSYVDNIVVFADLVRTRP